MVVLAASVCTRGGKAVLSRQFRELHKDRVTALLASFPKLTQSGTQHTSVEYDGVRYVYQPLEELYVVLITDTQSNILQDIDTLRLLAQIVSAEVRVVDEREILSHAFEIISAFDEVIALGYRENLTLPQIKSFLEMDSHEEKIQEIIHRNKELEAAEERKKKAKQLEIQRKEAMRRGPAPGMGDGFNGGFGSRSSSTYTTPQAPTTTPAYTAQTVYDYEDKAPKAKHGLRGKGLQLGGKKKSSHLDALRGQAEDSPLMAAVIDEPVRASPELSPAVAAATAQNTAQGVEIILQEGISAHLGRDGSVKSAEVRGNFQLKISDPNYSKISVLTNVEDPKIFKTHPNVHKGNFLSQKTIGTKDGSKGFPANNQPIAVVRWMLHSSGRDDLSLVPITFNCWFSRSDPGFFDVTLEYELNPEFTETLENVVVTIPLVSPNAHVADASQEFSQYNTHLEWTIAEITPNTDSMSGSFEFTAEADGEDEFFPMDVSFKVSNPLTTFGKVDVNDVVSSSDESISIPFEKQVHIATSTYRIE